MREEKIQIKYYQEFKTKKQKQKSREKISREMYNSCLQLRERLFGSLRIIFHATG